MSASLRALVVEDETSTREELADFLTRTPEIAEVTPVADGAAAIKLLGTTEFDAAFIDIAMPGLDGMEVARVLSRLNTPPAIVFVTASESHAIEAFGVGAVDYLLKPIRPERLAEAVSRINKAHGGTAAPLSGEDELAVVQIDSGGRTVFVRRDDVQFAEAHGDYVRLYTGEGSHLVRLSLAYLERVWSAGGFLRVHRGFLLSIAWVRDLRVTSSAGLIAATPAGDVPVSRRHARELKERLMAVARADQSGAKNRGAGAEGGRESG